ncbi:HpcH/HpaI aldolase family protein [Microbulbifer sp. S227A]|uniref:HpcH/HpaI aldolase family protein n=1 Tax=Microbulbifer sp. S227A TaxID=3415131 RepID=UPI003C79D5CD
MRENRILKVWSENGVVINGWLHNPSSYSAEVLANQDYDCLTIDLQHGMIDFQAAFGMLQAISSKPVSPIVRVPSHDQAMMMKMLDAGAYGLICPFINNREECEKFVGACKYPPVGVRSNGAHRAMNYAGADYMQHADDTIVTLAMIETVEGLKNVDEIASVDGLSGLFVGPADLAFSLGLKPQLELVDPVLDEAIDTIIAAAKRHNINVGTVSSNGEAARKCVERGFNFVSPGTETGLLAGAAASNIKIARGQ